MWVKSGGLFSDTGPTAVSELVEMCMNLSVCYEVNCALVVHLGVEATFPGTFRTVLNLC